MGLSLVYAHEADDNDNWQDAELLIPNGPSLSNSFLFYRDRDWYKFYAEEGVTYQIFTCPVKEYNLPDIVIFLFSDPTGDYIAHNEDIKIDGSAFIEWFCPVSGVYFIRVQALDPKIYGDREAYTMQITSIDYQEAYTFIPDVPDYSQSDFGNFWDCKVVASACILGYWDSHGYGLLVDSNPDRIEDVARLVKELHVAMLDSIQRSSAVKGFTDENVREGIEFFCNIPQYGNNYNFKVEYYPSPVFSKVIYEIENNRPVLYGVAGHPLWDNHWMVTVGYLKTDTTEWTINHDNWNTTHRDIYVDWDETAESIITIHPGRQESPKPFYLDFYPKLQYTPYPMVFPWLEPFPTFSFGMISPFNGINDVSIPTWSPPLNTGYSNQLNSGGSVSMVWSENQELYNDKRSMAGGAQLVSFSPYNYNDVNGYNMNGYNDTTGYRNIFSNPPQETYLGSDLGFYSYMNVPAQAPITPFNYPSFSLAQMFIPELALTASLGLFPFSFLSPGLFTGTFPFSIPF